MDALFQLLNKTFVIPTEANAGSGAEGPAFPLRRVQRPLIAERWRLSRVPGAPHLDFEMWVDAWPRYLLSRFAALSRLLLLKLLLHLFAALRASFRTLLALLVEELLGAQ